MCQSRRNFFFADCFLLCLLQLSQQHPLEPLLGNGGAAGAGASGASGAAKHQLRVQVELGGVSTSTSAAPGTSSSSASASASAHAHKSFRCLGRHCCECNCFVCFLVLGMLGFVAFWYVPESGNSAQFMRQQSSLRIVAKKAEMGNPVCPPPGRC